MDTVRFVVRDPFPRVDLFLAGNRPDLSRAYLSRLIREGHVTVNGRPVKPSRPLKEGDEVLLNIPPAVPLRVQAEKMDLVLLYRDEDIIVLNKPAGICVHPGAGRTTGTIVNGLLALSPALSSIGGVERPGIVHRLDRDTSGCLVVALNDVSHRSLSEAFRSREVDKVYLAVTAGAPPFTKGTIREPIGRHPVSRKKMTVRQGGRDAVTHVEVLQRSDRLSLVACRLETGRTHQIRVHLSHVNSPVLGDRQYGGVRKRIPFDRQALHALSLSFNHPRTASRMTFTAPLPEDMEALIVREGLDLALVPRFEG